MSLTKLFSKLEAQIQKSYEDPEMREYDKGRYLPLIIMNREIPEMIAEDLIRLGVRQPDAFNGGEPDPDCLGRWVGARMRSPSGARERPDRTG